jgi:hypothetical protein
LVLHYDKLLHLELRLQSPLEHNGFMQLLQVAVVVVDLAHQVARLVEVVEQP